MTVSWRNRDKQSLRRQREDNGNPEYIYELTTADGSLALDADENVGRMSRKTIPRPRPAGRIRRALRSATRRISGSTLD